MKFKKPSRPLCDVDGIGNVIEYAHTFAPEYERADLILTVLAALANNLPKEAQVALAQQLGYEPVEE